MERILPVNRSMTLRRPLALAIVLMIAGLAPAAAIIGFCARMPCCSHTASASLALANERADCCTTITCYESPAAKMANASSFDCAYVVAPALLSPAPVPIAGPSVAQAVVDTSPPLTLRHRLAVLSILVV
jgi:hypothetical protein